VFNTGPLLLLDTKLFHDKRDDIIRRKLYIPKRLPSEDTVWSIYYRDHERDITKTNELAPWVRRKLDSFEGLVDSSNRYNRGSS